MLFWLRLWHLTFGTPDGSIYASTGGRPFPAACLAMELKKLRLARESSGHAAHGSNEKAISHGRVS